MQFYEQIKLNLFRKNNLLFTLVRILWKKHLNAKKMKRKTNKKIKIT